VLKSIYGRCQRPLIPPNAWLLIEKLINFVVLTIFVRFWMLSDQSAPQSGTAKCKVRGGHVESTKSLMLGSYKSVIKYSKASLVLLN